MTDHTTADDAVLKPGEESIVADDKSVLHSMGYAQELLRGMRTFQNFAISFSIICILSGGLNSFGQGIASVGGGSIGIGWLVGMAVSLLFALAMGQIGSAYPTAGGLYHWGSILGGRGLGWVTAWCNLGGLVTVLAAINVGTYSFLVGAFAGPLGIDSGALMPATPTVYSIVVQTVIVAIITVSQGLFNHLGIKLTTKLTDFSGYLIFFGAIVLTVALLAYAPHIDISRLWTFKNYSGDAGGGVWPETHSMGYLFLLGLLLPAYTITGFDASAHTAEETIGAASAIPKGMINAVFWSGVFGWIMLCAIILATPDMDKAAGQGFNAFFWTMDQIMPTPLKMALYIVIGVSQYLCGLATVTSASRMIFAFSRDGGLPASKKLRGISPKYRTPVAAIWTAVVLCILFTVYTPVYTTIAAVCVILLYLSYLMPVAAGVLAYKKTWTKMGPFDLGGLYPVIAGLCVIGCAVLIYIGVQPPNDKALTVLAIAGVVTAIIWFGFEKRRFKGPPIGANIAERRAEIAAAEQALGEK